MGACKSRGSLPESIVGPLPETEVPPEIEAFPKGSMSKASTHTPTLTLCMRLRECNYSGPGAWHRLHSQAYSPLPSEGEGRSDKKMLGW